jgi:hypothetical protein
MEIDCGNGSDPAGRILADMILYLIGWLVIIAVFVLAQTRFYDTHQRNRNLWRPRSTPWLLAPSATELRAMLHATLKPDTNATIETARRRYVIVAVVAMAYLIVGLPIAIWLVGSN